MALFKRNEPPKEEALPSEYVSNGIDTTILPDESQIKLKIDKQAVMKANKLLLKYKSDKSRLDEKIIANEQWWKLRHWEQMETGSKNDPQTKSAWLWNCIVSKHADCMDSYPEPNVRPRMPDDVDEANRLKEVLPIILEQNNFEQTYSDVMWYKLKQGTGVYGVFWDGQANNGLGDIAIKRIDILNLFWESGCTDIQDSPNLFYVTLVNNDELERKYPQLKNKLGGKNNIVKKYHYDDNVDTTDKSAVVDWYYHTYENGKAILQYCKYCNNEVLFATENELENYPNGWYAHGKYPFVFDTLFGIEGTPCGYGYIDICKSAQEQIDVLNQAIIKNASIGARPRFFIRSDGNVNEEEYADSSRDFVHYQGVMDERSIRPIEVAPLAPIYMNVLDSKINEIKETSGNRDIANGGSTSGVTAASAIAAMQEASGKLSRDSNKMSYNAYKQLILMCIELIRQFYTMPRWFMIEGEGGTQEFTQYSNEALVPQEQGEAFGMNMGYRLPIFDIEVSAAKATPYSKMSQNELALQFNSVGFFEPQNAQSALACLQMMDFDHKDDVIATINQNNGIYQATMMGFQLAQQVAPELAMQMAQMLGMDMPTPVQQGAPNLPNVNDEGAVVPDEHPVVENARAQAQEASRVR